MGSGCDCSKTVRAQVNTLRYDMNRCVNCGRCSQVCPHRVFAPGDFKASLVNYERCMECGACMTNCPVGAIKVDSGVGCAYAMITSALLGRKEVTCGEDCCR
ncbi:MAG: 4Fe-4S binding protein [Methanomassiliicoccales archaeon]|nr:MAG: 4Fe-4S binding protein [Methanomassiliicoccales archaeon]